MHGQVSALVHSSAHRQDSVQITIYERGHRDRVLAEQQITTDSPSTFNVSHVKLWSPDSPNLYDVEVKLGDDTVKSYIGFRTIELGYVSEVPRPMLNGNFILPFGTLDQGYWPDGIYLPPNYDAMVYDIYALKAAGFNMLRKHIKVEPSLFYTACDEIGILVIQDMPSPRPLQDRHFANCTSTRYLPNATETADFISQLQIMVHQHVSHPSIIAWTIYNEAWGQPDTPLDNGTYTEDALTTTVRGLDPTRLIIATSGWHDHGHGDFHDTHTYSQPMCGTPFYKTPSSAYSRSQGRIAIQSEFGGIGHNASLANTWNVQQAIDTINQTYEITADLDTYNYRARQLLRLFREQVEQFACSGGVWTQTTDVEGEVNGLLTYDRRLMRIDLNLWRDEIQAIYDAAENRGARRYVLPDLQESLRRMEEHAGRRGDGDRAAGEKVVERDVQVHEAPREHQEEPCDMRYEGGF
jgi:hypothetical protein